MTKFDAIKNVTFKFMPHPTRKDAHTQMNQLYADHITFIEHFFTDATMDEVADNIMDQIRAKISAMIDDNATETTDIAQIKKIIDKAGLRIGYNGQSHRSLRDKKTFADCLTRAINDKKDTVDIFVSINHVRFNPTEQITYLNWNLMSTMDFPKVHTPAPLSASDITTAVVAGIARSGPTAGTGTSAPTTTTATTSSSYASSGSIAMSTFNYNGLPADVKEAYLRNYNNEIQLKSQIKCFAGTSTVAGRRYYQDGPERLILGDGTLYIVQEPNEKGLFREPVYCIDDTHVGIRSWYRNFTRYAMDYGFYVHPFYCFQKNHGGEQGFTAGDTVDDDLPRSMQAKLRQRMAQPLFRLLSKPEMFPRNSHLNGIVQRCYGDGYAAIKQIIFNSHPIFHEQPSVMIRKYPVQKNLSLTEYYSVFKDFLQLRAFIADIPGSLDTDSELDIFINNANYAHFLNQSTIEDRQRLTSAHKYKDGQIVETLMKLLMAPHSPAMNAGSTRLGRPRARQEVSVHRIAASGSQDSGRTDGSVDSLDSLCNEMMNMSAPSEDQPTYFQYGASIHRIRTDRNVADKTPCIVCNGNHRFDDCSVLKNTEYLKGHHIRFCQHLRREANSRSSTFQGSEGNLPSRSSTTTAANVNFVDRAVNSDEQNNDSARDDFQERYGQYQDDDTDDEGPDFH